MSRLRQGRAGYAESRDDIHWSRPALGLHKFGGEQTNICFPLQPGLSHNEYQLPVEVVRDDEAPPKRRYVMFLLSQGPHAFIVNVAVSPDGRNFSVAPHNARHYGFDSEPRDSTLHGTPVVCVTAVTGGPGWATWKANHGDIERAALGGWCLQTPST